MHSFYTQLLSQTFVIYKPNMTHVVPQHTKNRIQLYMNLVFLRNIFNVHSKSSQVKSNNNPIKLFICCLFYEFGLCCSSNSIISILFYFSSVKTIVYSFFFKHSGYGAHFTMRCEFAMLFIRIHGRKKNCRPLCCI